MTNGKLQSYDVAIKQIIPTLCESIKSEENTDVKILKLKLLNSFSYSNELMLPNGYLIAERKIILETTKGVIINDESNNQLKKEAI